MKKGELHFSANMEESNISQINHLIKVLGRHLEKFEEAHKEKDPLKFNLIKREIIQIQRKIHSLIR